jgi:hypothetical protein
VATPHFDYRVIDPAFGFAVVAFFVELSHNHKALPCFESLLMQALVVEKARRFLK